MVNTLAGQPQQSGSTDGPGITASFGSLGGIDVDSAGNVYVADSGNSKIRKITPDGVVSTLAGNGQHGSAVDGPGSTASFSNLRGIAVDGSGIVYVTDTDNNAGLGTVRRISPNGDVTTLLGGSANGLYSPTKITFTFRGGIAVDSANNLIVSADDSRIYKIGIGY
jgi:sugar lactone lactonase YvrE